MSGRRDGTTQLLIQKDTSSLTSQYEHTSKFQPSSGFGMGLRHHNILGLLVKTPSHSQDSVSHQASETTPLNFFIFFKTVSTCIGAHFLKTFWELH